MAGHKLVSVLGILRRLRDTPELKLDHSALQFIQNWNNDHSQTVTLQLAASIQGQIADALQAIEASSLNEEAKSGLRSTLSGLKSAFSLEGINQAIRGFIPDISASITNFSIVTSLIDQEFPEAARQGIEELVTELESILSSVREADIDPSLKEAAVRHIGILIALLRNAEAVGAAPALGAFVEMMWQLQTLAKGNADTSSKGTGPTLWKRISAVGDKIKDLADMVESGSKLLPYLEKAPELLRYFPG
jgi:hypothetical protein